LPYLATLFVLTAIALRTKLALSMARRRFRAQLRAEQAVVPAEKTA
jgi:hypothetical protein